MKQVFIIYVLTSGEYYTDACQSVNFEEICFVTLVDLIRFVKKFNFSSDIRFANFKNRAMITERETSYHHAVKIPVYSFLCPFPRKDFKLRDIEYDVKPGFLYLVHISLER